MKHFFDCITDFIFIEDAPAKADIILIPGGSKAQLAEKAAELFKQGLAPLILFSGGYNEKIPDWKSEWEYLRNIAVAKGVPESAFLKEDQAKNTFDNARLSWETIQRNNLNIKKVIFVCKSYHARRALLTYQTVFPSNVEFIVCPIVDDLDIKKDNWFLDDKKISRVMEEVEKIGKYFAEHIARLAKK